MILFGGGSKPDYDKAVRVTFFDAKIGICT